MATVPLPTRFRDAFGAAVNRVVEVGLFDGEPDLETQVLAAQTLEKASGVLSGDEPERYVALFGEVVAVAAFARARYGEAPLDEDSLGAFHVEFGRFLNSWMHRHGAG